jgi:drug/metabolite transporter (DMT)-like permease
MARGTSAFGLTRVDLALLTVPVIWGVNYTVIKAALLELQPFAFNGLRFTLATFTILMLLLHRGTPLRIPREGLLRLILLGVLGNTVYQILFIEGVALTTAANASLIMASVPMLVAVLATTLRRDRLLGRGWVGVALAVAGIVLVLSSWGTCSCWPLRERGRCTRSWRARRWRETHTSRPPSSRFSLARRSCFS